MSQQGAALQTYNNELVKCVDGYRAESACLKYECLEKMREIRQLNRKKALLKARSDYIDDKIAFKKAMLEDVKSAIDKKFAEYNYWLGDSHSFMRKVKDHSLVGSNRFDIIGPPDNLVGTSRFDVVGPPDNLARTSHFDVVGPPEDQPIQRRNSSIPELRRNNC